MGMKKTALILAIGICSVASIAQAADLVLNNNTGSFVTSWINDLMCSNLIPDGSGITQPWEQNHVITSSTINTACWFHKDACKADIYLSDNCTGDNIATIVLNTQTGGASIQMHSPAYDIKNSGFTFTLNPVNPL